MFFWKIVIFNKKKHVLIKKSEYVRLKKDSESLKRVYSKLAELSRKFKK